MRKITMGILYQLIGIFAIADIALFCIYLVQ